MKKLLLALSISSLSTPLFAQDAPDASSLVGKYYGGLHALYLHNDSDRSLAHSWATQVVDGKGFGGDLGYRLNESVELRISYTDFNLNLRDDNAYENYSDKYDFNALYFPNKQNGYLIAGLSSVKINGRGTSANLGAGYRYYISDKFSVYLEGKGYYDLFDYYKDYTTAIGFTYFFGDSPKAAPAKKAAPVVKEMVAPTPVLVDSDNDGVYDSEDKCADSNVKYKVDATGCTIYQDKLENVNLLVNFANNSSIVTSDYVNKIQSLADFMQAYPSTSVVIEGHASKSGSADYNMMISQKRAESVKKLLIEKFGIDASRVEAKGYGITRLLDDADTIEANKKNRRIEAAIQTSVKVPVIK
jgi:OOP family OmpA-OmpF porin